MTMDEFCNICSTKCTELCRCHWFFFFFYIYTITSLLTMPSWPNLSWIMFKNVKHLECVYFTTSRCWNDSSSIDRSKSFGIVYLTFSWVTQGCELASPWCDNSKPILLYPSVLFSNAVYSHVNTKMNIVDEYTVTVKKTVMANSNSLTHNSIISGQWWCTSGPEKNLTR